MKEQVDIQLPFEDDETIVEQIVEFFRPVATPSIQKKEQTEIKAWGDPVVIVLTIVCEWAATRYVLDPLADRVEEWWRGISSLWEKSKPKRRLNIVAKFDHITDRLEIEITDTSDPEVLKQVWYYIMQVSRAYQYAKNRGIQLGKVQILADGTQDMLVIGYEDNRPTYTVDLENQALKKIKQLPPSGESRDASAELWILGQLIRRLDYLRALAEMGYDVSTSEISELESEIQVKKLKLRA
jgi:hypothetical protein